MFDYCKLWVGIGGNSGYGGRIDIAGYIFIGEGYLMMFIWIGELIRG